MDYCDTFIASLYPDEMFTFLQKKNSSNFFDQKRRCYHYVSSCPLFCFYSLDDMKAMQILEHNGYSRESEGMSGAVGKILGNYLESGSHPFYLLDYLFSSLFTRNLLSPTA